MDNFTFWTLGFWIPLIIIILIWSLIWKGLALWKAARKGDEGWFIVFLIINTLGILEILYIYIFSRSDKRSDLDKGNTTPLPKKEDEK